MQNALDKKAIGYGPQACKMHHPCLDIGPRLAQCTTHVSAKAREAAVAAANCGIIIVNCSYKLARGTSIGVHPVSATRKTCILLNPKQIAVTCPSSQETPAPSPTLEYIAAAAGSQPDAFLAGADVVIVDPPRKV